MKTKFLVAIALLFGAIMTSSDTESNKLILGEWCNPYTYQSSGEIKGYNFKKGGKCEGINVATLDLKNWKIENGRLIITGFSVDKNGTKTEYVQDERIEKITNDSLLLVSQEENPRLVFLYVRPAIAKKAYKIEKK